jgi:hypothetical protein
MLDGEVNYACFINSVSVCGVHERRGKTIQDKKKKKCTHELLRARSHKSNDSTEIKINSSHSADGTEKE